MDLSSKPLAAISPDDVRAFVDEHPPESDTLELKEALPAAGVDVGTRELTVEIPEPIA